MRWQRFGIFLGGLLIWLNYYGPMAYAKAPAAAPIYNDDIVSFHSDLTINQDTSLAIQETIVYQTTKQKHGIYRYLPYRYTRDGFTVSTRVRDMQVTNSHQQPIPFTTSWSSNNLELKIGDPDQTFTGQQTYHLSYTVERALMDLQQQPRLYWDIVGDGWQIPVHTVTATLHSPYAAWDNPHCFSGATGGSDGLCQIESIDSHTWQLRYNQTINYGDNVTVDSRLVTPHQLHLPSPAEEWQQMLKDNWWWLLVVMPIPLSFYIWYRWGRDWEFVRYNLFDHSPRAQRLVPLWPRRPPALVYEPLTISPGLAAAVYYERYTTAALVADITDLAHQQLITITQIQSKTFWRAADYLFTRTSKSAAHLPDHQQLLLQKICSTDHPQKLSALKGQFATTFTTIQQKVMAQLKQDQLLQSHTGRRQGLALLFFVIWGILLALVLGSSGTIPYLDGYTTFGLWAWLVADVLAAIVCLINLRQKSARGTNYARQARGLQHTIQRGLWREKIAEKELFFADMLPFAIALGVVNRLTKDMAGLSITPPTYLPITNLHTYQSGFVTAFAQDLGSHLTYNPRSNSWSSGGGGFSGGGGGGGGGGSW